jgi:divalent metal cation (Fe/Co/Zn/Cd) transporter
MDAIESITCIFMATALLGGLLAEYFLGFWWADYLATGIILSFVAREAVESYHEIHEDEAAVHGSPECFTSLAAPVTYFL